MKRFAVVIFLLAIFFALPESPGSAAGRGKLWTGSRGWGPDTPYVRLYNPRSVETIEGIVTAVKRFIPGRGMSSGLRLLVRVGLDIVDVHLGPAWYLENQDITIRSRDQVQVKGSRVIFRGQPAIIAAEVRKGENVLRVRDEDGFPGWIAWGRR